MKIIYMAHYFPPIGGAGVQRSVKFVKHLPACGVVPLVLTGRGTAGGYWSPQDPSLGADLDRTVPVFRAEWREGEEEQRRGALLRLGDQIIREHQPSLIFVSMSPFGDARIAAELARKHHLPWIADLRDPWALDEFQVYRTRWHRWRERQRMAAALSSAASIIMNTPEAMVRFRRAFPALAARARVVITNGYDADDFPPENWHGRNEQFTVVHAGYLHTDSGLHQRQHALQYRLLGRIEAGVEMLPRSHYYLMQALEKWLGQEPAIAGKVRVVFVGVPAGEDRELVDASSARSLVEFTGYMSHKECVLRVRGGDLLFLPMHKMPPGRRSTIVPGKTYEYMATGKPILAALPEGDARDFLKQAGTGLICAPDDVEGMAGILRTQQEAWEHRRETISGDRSLLETFERRNLTRQLADELEWVAGDKQGGPKGPRFRNSLSSSG